MRLRSARRGGGTSDVVVNTCRKGHTASTEVLDRHGNDYSAILS
jgi:hypothetical protein